MRLRGWFCFHVKRGISQFMTNSIRIGTRGSRLALVQAEMVARGLHPLKTEIVAIATSGDWKPEQGEIRFPAGSGGKALFAREIEQALLEGRIDCGVHSLKDLPAILPDGLGVEHVLKREDPRDVFLSQEYGSIDALPEGATVGTASPRRQALLLARRPDLTIVPLRGNVPTRLEKLKSGMADGIVLAAAGLKRLGLEREIRAFIEPEIMLPAAAQGIIGIEIRRDDDRMRGHLCALHCRETGLRAAAERAVMEALGASCHTPAGAYAVIAGSSMTLSALVASPDGREVYRRTLTGEVATAAEAREFGLTLGAALKAETPAALLAA